MTHLNPNQTTVAALVFVKIGKIFHLLLVWPEEAADNRNLISGRIRQVGAKSHELPRVAMVRELLTQAAISTRRGFAITFTGLGKPIDHLTYCGEFKSVRGFLLVTKEQDLKATGVRSVETHPPGDWGAAIQSCNPRKQELIKKLFRRAENCSGIPSGLRKQLGAFNRSQLEDAELPSQQTRVMA